MRYFIQIYYTTTSTKKEATRIGNSLVQMRAIACYNVFGIESGYNWEGHIENSQEYGIIMKSLDSDFSKMENLIRRYHSYDVFVLTRREEEVNKKYFNWMNIVNDA